jgi:hypothetical protein
MITLTAITHISPVSKRHFGRRFPGTCLSIRWSKAEHPAHADTRRHESPQDQDHGPPTVQNEKTINAGNTCQLTSSP